YGPLPFLVMKRLEGTTLSRVLRKLGKLPPAMALGFLKQAAAGLDYVHARGLIHRGGKTSNLFVGEGGHLTLLEFGVTRDTGASTGMTRPGSFMGTPHYIAPEMALGKAQVDYRVDLYALGVVLYEMLTGTRPFEGDNEMALVQAHARERPPDPCSREP